MKLKSNRHSAVIGFFLAFTGIVLAPATFALPELIDPMLDNPRGLVGSTDAAAPGYVLFSPSLSRSSYLVDTEGQVVHSWRSSKLPMSTYFLDNGNLLSASIPDTAPVRVGGQSGSIQEYSWDGELIWDYDLADDQYLLHHDIAPLPNGNILALAWEMLSTEEGRANGRRPDLQAGEEYWPDTILELEKSGSTGANIVWQWRARDHYVQDFDSSAANYGVVAEHPELININALAPSISEAEKAEMLESGAIALLDIEEHDETQDAMHLNAVTYNPELDQIVFSSPYYNEIFVIDHSTTTAEAATSSGGDYGMGGDIIYRWGNPANYGRGTAEDQKLFGQHHPRWTEAGLPGAGNITVFNNNFEGDDETYTRILELEPPLNNLNRYVMSEGGTFGPADPVWSYSNLEDPLFRSWFISGAHRLPNGNTLIDSGARGRIFEVTPEGDTVWDYWNPFAGPIENEFDQNTAGIMSPYFYMVFRATKLAPDHLGLSGRDLAPLNPQPAAIPYPRLD